MDDGKSKTDSRHCWTPPAGLDRSRPRAVQFTGSGRFLLALSIALGLGAVAAGAGLGVRAAREAEESRLLKNEGRETEGLVTRLWRSGDKNHQPWVAYQFSFEGRVYLRNARLPVRVWRNLRVGSYLPVRFADSRPEINYPSGYARGPLPPWVPVLAASALAAGGFLATLPIRCQQRLLSSGRAAPGQVTALGKAVRSSHGSNMGQPFFYRFPVLSGAIKKGKGGPSTRPPAVGSTITVLYDPDNPRINSPYPLSLVRLPDASRR